VEESGGLTNDYENENENDYARWGRDQRVGMSAIRSTRMRRMRSVLTSTAVRRKSPEVRDSSRRGGWPRWRVNHEATVSRGCYSKDQPVSAWSSRMVKEPLTTMENVVRS
jgi:hypothetical protein